MRRAFNFLLSLFAFASVVGLLGAVAVFYYFGRGLPDYQQLKVYDPPIVSRLYAKDGRVFAEYATEKRLFVPVNVIPMIVRRAFISAEDKNFYSHWGVDPLSTMRALFRNLSQMGRNRRPHGASTITQQVARNFLLVKTSKIVSYQRKIKEAILSFRIEYAYSKDHILELYLNEIYLGSRAYGVAAAALNYFNKGLEELTIAEAALLAAMPKAPSQYNPFRNPKRALERRNWVIGRMLEEGAITPAEALTAKQEPIHLKLRDTSSSVKASYFAEEVRRELSNQFGEDVLYEGGLAVRTTLDPKLQKICERTLRQGLLTYDRRHGWRGPLASLEISLEELSGEGWIQRINNIQPQAGQKDWKLGLVLLSAKEKEAVVGFKDGTTGKVFTSDMSWARKWISNNSVGSAVKKTSDVLNVGDVVFVKKKDDGGPQDYLLRQLPKVSGGMVVMNPHTGSVLAMTGGYSFQMSQFNRATQALRQPGSTFKTFAYLAGLEKGLTPASIIQDAPIAIDLGPYLGVWKPHNYSKNFFGPTRMRMGLEKSRNIVVVRLIHDIVGMEAVRDIGIRFGLYKSLPLQLAMVLGAGETTALKVAAAYATFVNGGRQVIPSFVDRVQDRRGQNILTGNVRECEQCDKQAWEGQDTPPDLQDDRPFLIDPARAYQMVSLLEGAVLRGTARRARSVGKPLAGKTGTTNDFKDAWFAGFSPDLVMVVYVGFDNPVTLGEAESGSRVACPIFTEFMKEALKDEPAMPFRVPPGVTFVRIDPDTGALASPGQENAILEVFKAGTEPEVLEADLTRQVIEQQKEVDTGTGGLY
ncbi:MAG: penicillin-binding protein 1A [bacterium]|nr:penicillin-binding protein 1A [bacterium]